MTRRIREDHKEFRDLVGGKVDDEIKKFIKMGHILGNRPKGGKFIINIPRLDIPTIRFGKNRFGWGRGEGEVGDIIKGADGKKSRKAGQLPGETIPVAVDLEYILDLMKEELELPNLKSKDEALVYQEKIVYNGIRKVGPESLRHNRRTMKQAMLRMIQTGEYNPSNPVVVPIQDDKRYKSWNMKKFPHSNAVIFFARDWSGSMSNEKCDIITNAAWWIDCWIRQFYERTETVYIGHDTEAQEVDQEKFYKMRYGGGTTCSSAFKMIQESIEVKFPCNSWNVYVFYFSDGENYSEDNDKCIEILTDLQYKVNLIGIGQILCEGYFDEDSTLLYIIRDAIGEGTLDARIFRTYNYPDEDSEKSIKMITKFLGKHEDDFEEDYYSDSEIEPEEEEDNTP